MDKNAIFEKVKELGILAVIRGPSPELTIKMVEALIAGGVIGIEITYSTPNAEEVVQVLSKKFGSSIILGMGTLTKPEQAVSAKAAGACFLVSPVCEPKLGTGLVDSGVLTPRFLGWPSLY
jgi:2-dehydro-3-deoxyphosphogluconate aldolase/(4S)-4-hydroxy-2-oxoglutarate aldolase